MADEFGEDFVIYVWPKGHPDGTPLPTDFHKRLTEGLSSVGIAWEPA